MTQNIDFNNELNDFDKTVLHLINIRALSNQTLELIREDGSKYNATTKLLSLKLIVRTEMMINGEKIVAYSMTMDGIKYAATNDLNQVADSFLKRMKTYSLLNGF